MRWDRLFDDLEAELDAAGAAEQSAEIAERTRLELAQVAFADRLAASSRPVLLELLGGSAATGRVVAVGDGWCVVGDEQAVLVPMAAVVSVSGLARAARPASADGVTRRLSLASALRRVARDRSAVLLRLVDGRSLTGTLDAVAADHLELSEHGLDDVRRPGAVLRARCVPFAAVAALTPAGPSSLT